MDKPITSTEQFTIEANAQKFATCADSERSYKMTTSERRAARDRKRDQRARIAQQEDSERLRLEAEKDKQRVQQKRELTGLCSWNEIRPGVQAIGRDEFIPVLEFAKRFGMFSLGETAGHFAQRVYAKWLRDNCPLLDRASNQLVANTDKDAVLFLAGFSHGDCSPLDLAAVLVEVYARDHSNDDWWSVQLPCDPRAQHIRTDINQNVKVPLNSAEGEASDEGLATLCAASTDPQQAE